MPAWTRRLVYSMVSVFAGVAIVTMALWILSTPRPKLAFETAFFYGYFTLMWSIPGWIIAVPVVLLVGNYSGWRMWLWGAVGCCIGPALLLGLAAFSYLTEPLLAGFAPGSWKFLLMAGAVSSITTVAYLTLVKRSLPSASQLAAPNSRSKNA
jgi:hypothetical protein